VSGVFDPLLRLGEHSTAVGGSVKVTRRRMRLTSQVLAEVRAAPRSERSRMHLRRTQAQAEDLATLLPTFADIYVRMIRECGLEGIGFVDDWRERLVGYFSGELRRGAMSLYLAQAGDEVVGSAAVFVNDGKTNQILRDRSATIAGVFVEPAYRGRGIARQLTESAVAWARKRGCTSIRLTTSEAAEPLYRRMGFQDGRELVLKLPPL
jgi:GNAT superfamily N-acetyltransferase